MLQFVDLGQIDRVDEHQAGETAGGGSQNEEKGERDGPGDLAIAGSGIEAGIAGTAAERERGFVGVRFGRDEASHPGIRIRPALAGRAGKTMGKKKGESAG